MIGSSWRSIFSIATGVEAFEAPPMEERLPAVDSMTLPMTLPACEEVSKLSPSRSSREDIEGTDMPIDEPRLPWLCAGGTPEMEALLAEVELSLSLLESSEAEEGAEGSPGVFPPFTRRLRKLLL
jgi:hypothetical protein